MIKATREGCIGFKEKLQEGHLLSAWGVKATWGNSLCLSNPTATTSFQTPLCVIPTSAPTWGLVFRPPVCCVHSFIHVAARVIGQKRNPIMSFPDLKAFNNFPLPHTKIQPSVWLMRHSWPLLLSLIFPLVVPCQLQLQSPTCPFPKPPSLFEPWASTHVCAQLKTNCPALKIHHIAVQKERCAHEHTRAHTHCPLPC